MTASNWIEVGSLIVEIFKTLIPFGFIFLIIWIFKKEIKNIIKNGGLKVTVPGASLETLQKQQEKIGAKEKKEIQTLNNELDTSKEREKKLQELQEYTTRDKDTYFLGYHFEKTYRLIFPSQMVILNSLNNLDAEIIEDLPRALFRRTIWAQQFNVTFEQFMGFLSHNGLINYVGSKIKLTPLGKTFMEYLTNNNIPLKIPANDMIFENKQTQ